ncbi:Rrf2 family transcriptional regulator [Patescibacteria group bacterium]|nr:Rrf2 family transcriptional regulator [Patescibacteria group bacterium]
MKFSREEDLSILIVSFIAKYKDRVISASDIALGIGIPLPFTRKIIYKLKNSGILKGREGKNGGYILNMKPGLISVKDIIESVSGSISQYECVNGHCPIEDKCISKTVLNKIGSEFINKLSEIKISSMI